VISTVDLHLYYRRWKYETLRTLQPVSTINVDIIEEMT
jgi:hypothetical protein